MALTFKNLTFWSAEHPKHQLESLRAVTVQHSESRALNDCAICHGIAAAPTAAESTQHSFARVNLPTEGQRALPINKPYKFTI